MGGSMTLLLLLLAMIGLAGARVRVYNWDVRRELKSPSSYKKQVVTINRESPGPTIQAGRGDRVFVSVINRLEENLAIHWDGTRQIKSLGSDGTEAINQRPIFPGENFTYRFIADRLGKSPYYSYYRSQTVDGLHGFIDVLPPYSMTEPSACDYGKSIILDDQYYKSYYDCAAEPESLLIPRKGKFDYAESTAPSSHPTACDGINPEYLHWRVLPGKTYRLNISSVTAQSALSFRIEDHNLTVVEADGHYIVPSLIVYSGKTYSVKIKADQDPSRNYSITTNIVGQNASATTPLGLAVLSYSPPAGPIQNDVTP
ncbi:L-ascorbate oxidase [Eucalyptus grandis]|uniref:L-ascorbate oxidase n=1 Tax=Eucalyptus grandis TaxID=71139 RepID=UPI00192EBE2B|nr:L-ascorbate oxidase [Eucalyptus grandis]XP_039157488.1 L-ascorbate oxidase [Eucalyptus grandis]